MKFLQAFFLAFAIYAVVLTNIACDQNQIRKAAKASDQLSGLTLDAVRATKQAYTDGLITLEQKDRIADKLLVLASGGQTFNAVVKQTAANSGAMTTDKWLALEKLFDVEVITPFLEFLAQTAGVASATKLNAAIGLIRLSVLTIAQVFGRTSENIHQKFNRTAEVLAMREVTIYV